MGLSDMSDFGRVLPNRGDALRRHALLANAFVGLFLSVLSLGARFAAAQVVPSNSPLVGQVAPDFTLRGLAGRNVRLSDHRGEVVLLGFWTSWCSACKAELEQISRLSDTYHSAGLVVIGVSLDDDKAKAAAFAVAHGGSVINVFDGTKVTGKSYQIADVPLTMLVDRNGVVRFSHGEYSRRDEQDLVQQLRLLLDE
jgi:peroxiredoxin